MFIKTNRDSNPEFTNQYKVSYKSVDFLTQPKHDVIALYETNKTACQHLARNQ